MISWACPAANLRRVEHELHRLAKARQTDNQLLPVPVAEPLILGNRAIFRTLQHIQAVDLQTGETLWKTAQTDARLRPVMSQSSARQLEQLSQRGMFAPNGPQTVEETRSALGSFLVQRTWRDMTFGVLSGDSRRVYSIENVGLADGMYFAKGSRNDPFPPKTYNTMMAFGVAGGQAEWEVGGPRVDNKDPLGGTFFLGSPLPIGEQLFCLGERNNEIALLALQSSTGKLEWEQRLVMPELSLLANRERRVMGLSPTSGQGVLICPTASGAVVAVDVTRRMLLWAYEYESTQTEETLVANMAWQRGGNLEFSHESIHPESRWADCVPIIAQGRVLITPSDSQALHCLDLSTGELQWVVQREQGVYLAGVENGLAIVVGRSQVRAFRLTDGRDAWTTPVSIPLPAGRGFIAEGRLHLPLSTGEVGTVDLKHGRLIARTPTPGGQTLGNLVSAGGRVLFQSVDAIGAFSPWDQMLAEIHNHLKANPHDGQALALRGILRLHRGEDAQAVADLRQAWKLKPTEETRSILVARMLEGLRSDPANFQAYREELRPLIRGSEESLQFLTLTASGANTPESRAEVFRDYLKLARTLGGTNELQKLSESHQVRGDCWLKARIEQLAAKASPQELVEWNTILERELPGLLKNLPALSQQQVLSSFPRLPAVEQAELAYLQAGRLDGQLLQKTILLESLRKSPREKMQAQAALELAETYLKVGRETEAYPLIEELGKKWPQTWREDFKDLKPPQTAAWPDRKLQATFHPRSVAVLPEVHIALAELHHSPYANWSFSIDRQSQRLLARDENGYERWYLDLGEIDGPIIELDNITLSLRGHLGVLTFKTHFAVLDLISRKHTATVLWSAPLMEGEIDIDEMLRQRQFQRNQLFRGGPITVGDHFGWVALLSEDLIVYQSGERITAADSLTGKPRWVRENARARSRIFGDENLAVIVAPDAASAMFARADDGEMLNVAVLPALKNQVAFRGPNLIAWANRKNQQVLESRHLQTGELLWKIDCPPGTTSQKVGTDELALFQPDGKFLVVSLAKGTIQVNAKLELGEVKHSHEVCRLANCYLLLSSGDNPPGGLARNPFLSETTGIPVNGPIYAFDRHSGKLLWKTQIKDQILEQLPPDHSPVIMFDKRRQAGIGGFADNAFRVQILDLRTGDVIYEHNKRQHVSPLSIRVQPARKMVTITFYEGVIEVELTKEPLASPRS